MRDRRASSSPLHALSQTAFLAAGVHAKPNVYHPRPTRAGAGIVFLRHPEGDRGRGSKTRRAATGNRRRAGDFRAASAKPT